MTATLTESDGAGAAASASQGQSDSEAVIVSVMLEIPAEKEAAFLEVRSFYCNIEFPFKKFLRKNSPNAINTIHWSSKFPKRKIYCSKTIDLSLPKDC
jgi:hypothetical protein